MATHKTNLEIRLDGKCRRLEAENKRLKKAIKNTIESCDIAEVAYGPGWWSRARGLLKHALKGE